LGLIDGEGSSSEGILAAAELAGVKQYTVVDLPSFLGMAPVQTPEQPAEAAQSLLAQAPPGAIFMLDSRIPFPALPLPSGLEGLPPKRSGDNSLFPDEAASRATLGWLRTLPTGQSAGD